MCKAPDKPDVCKRLVSLNPQVMTRCFLCGKDVPIGDTAEVEQMLLCPKCAEPADKGKV